MRREVKGRATMECVGDDRIGWNLYVVVDGVRVARRGRPGTPQADTWIVMEPGWQVYDDFDADGEAITVAHDGRRVH
jgi:hypothetical protein